jgi:hypothetical protein
LVEGVTTTPLYDRQEYLVGDIVGNTVVVVIEGDMLTVGKRDGTRLGRRVGVREGTLIFSESTYQSFFQKPPIGEMSRNIDILLSSTVAPTMLEGVWRAVSLKR